MALARAFAMSPPPLVSFVLATYNGAPFLAEAIASAAAQTYPHVEIIVVDDGSTDDSAAIAEACSAHDDRVRVIRIAHAGPQQARNIGVAAVRGDFVAHLDHDDIASPDRIATQLAWIDQHGMDICGGCTRVFGDHRYLGWVPERHDDILRESVFRNAFIHPTAFLPAWIAKAYPFDPSHLCGGDELPIRLALGHGFRLGNVPQALIKYRHSPGQRTRAEAPAMLAHRLEIMRRVFRHLFPEADRADETAIMKVTRALPFASTAERDRAAVWMDRLSATDDPMLRRLMAERWAAAVERVAGSANGAEGQAPLR